MVQQECVVEGKGLFQLGARGMVLRTRSRKHWAPGEVQIFEEYFENEANSHSKVDEKFGFVRVSHGRGGRRRRC